MNKLAQTFVIAALAALVTPNVAFASVPATATQNVPGQMNYQGVLRDPSTGAPYADGIYTLDLRIWSNASSTSSSGCLWGGQYSVYVKDGYFNVMLGDSAGKNLTAGATGTYKNDELWKAMWGKDDTATYYLGVTPHEDSRNAVITSPSEILPRQQLLSSPFAFRAQHAKYADRSNASTFTVETNLTVSGSTTLNGAITINGNITANGTGTQKFGPISTTSTQVSLTGYTTKPTASNYSSIPTVYDVGRFLYFYSYSDIQLASTAGNISLVTPSSGAVAVSGGEFKSTAVNNTIGNTSGTTTISGGGSSGFNINGTGTFSLYGNKFDIDVSKGTSPSYLWSGGVLSIKSAKSDLSLAAATNVSVTANSGSVNLSGSVIHLNGGVSGTGVTGRGQLKWEPYGSAASSSSPAVSPFKWIDLQVTVPANAQQKTVTLSSSNVANFIQYDWVVAHVSTGFSGLSYVSSSKPTSSSIGLVVQFSSTSSSARGVSIMLMGVHKNFTGSTYTSLSL